MPGQTHKRADSPLSWHCSPAVSSGVHVIDELHTDVLLQSSAPDIAELSCLEMADVQTAVKGYSDKDNCQLSTQSWVAQDGVN